MCCGVNCGLLPDYIKIKMKKSVFNLSLAVVVLLSAAILYSCQDNDSNMLSDSFTIHTIGDSTMANKKASARPETGWGECLLSHIVDTAKVRHINYAINGRSTKSFLAEGRWENVKKNVKAGDFVLIQFGHNDQKDNDTMRYTNASTVYKANLKKFVAESRALNATPILLTSIVRRNFNEYGVLIDTHGYYPEVMRQVASEMNVALVDAQLISENLVLSYGPEKSRLLYNHVDAGHENYPDGKADDTHLNCFGASKIADLLVGALRQVDTRLASALK